MSETLTVKVFACFVTKVTDYEIKAVRDDGGLMGYDCVGELKIAENQFEYYKKRYQTSTREVKVFIKKRDFDFIHVYNDLNCRPDTRDNYQCIGTYVENMKEELIKGDK